MSKTLNLQEIIELGLDKARAGRLTSTLPIREAIRSFLKSQGLALVLTCDEIKDGVPLYPSYNEEGFPNGGMRQVVSQEVKALKIDHIGFVPNEAMEKGRIKSFAVVKTAEVQKAKDKK